MKTTQTPKRRSTRRRPLLHTLRANNGGGRHKRVTQR